VIDGGILLRGSEKNYYHQIIINDDKIIICEKYFFVGDT